MKPDACTFLILVSQPNVTTKIVNNIVYQTTRVATEELNVLICGGCLIGTLFESNPPWYDERTPESAVPATSFGTIANPHLISATNYHSRRGSHAIGAGIPVEGVTIDFDALPRLDPLSIGAFEWSNISMCSTLSVVAELPSDH